MEKEYPTVTYELIERLKSPDGGFSGAAMAYLGFEYSNLPPKGWMDRLIGKSRKPLYENMPFPSKEELKSKARRKREAAEAALRDEKQSAIPSDRMNTIIEAAVAELNRATSIHGPFNSAHEGWAVLREEFDELWDEIKMRENVRSKKKMRTEAIQLAAMAIRFVYDICSED